MVSVPRLSLLQPCADGGELERRAREALGPERFTEHRRRGRALTVDETVRFAHGEPLGPPGP